MADWPSLQRALWRAVRAHEARIGETTAEFRDAIVAAVRAAGYVLDAETSRLTSEYLEVMDGMVRGAVEASVVPVATEALPAAMRSDFVARRMADAYDRRWPDGLRLSDRVWRWQDATRQGVGETLRRGIDLQHSVNRLTYDLQRSIERSAQQRFAIEINQVDDWARDLARTGRRLLQGRSSIDQWLQTIEATRTHLDKLAEGGTRRQAEAVFRVIRAAVRDGSEAAIEKSLDWWIYDRQLYSLRRIVRTEMATAQQRAIIASSYDDPDVIGYRWRLSASHPVWDICDLYAGVEFGLGEGVFPREHTPSEKAHPHCMCSLTPVTRARAKPGNVSWDALQEASTRPIETWPR